MVETNPGKRTGNPDNTLLEALGVIKWIKCTQMGMWKLLYVSIHTIYKVNRNELFLVRTTREVISRDDDI